MRRLFWVLMLAAVCGCSSFQAPGPYLKSDIPQVGSMLEPEGPTIAHDYGNKLTL